MSLGYSGQGSNSVAWFENCVPHYDIRAGNLDESIFAANLDEVMKGTATEEYNSAQMFFSKTFVTAGLKDIIKRVIQALNGEQTENRVISLQTGFGGGKTHALIAIYHIAKAGNGIADLPSCADLFSDAKMRPQFESASCAVFTNNTTDVSQGRITGDGITIHTMWGEIAYQLGGKDAYEAVRKNDEELIAPGSAIIKPILQAASPCLILVDELADYCVKASGKSVAGGTLFNQTNSFIQALTETVSQVPKCVLIITLPASSSEVSSSEEGVAILQALNNRIVRVGTNVKPVGDEEVFEVVRRRLFEKITRTEPIENAVSRFRALYERYKADLPEFCLSSDYGEKMKKAYPFHPELIEIFKTRWGSDYRFQRTRGVLRLLASIVQDLWLNEKYKSRKRLLIMPSDVSLDRLDALTGTITSLMGHHWESVISADVCGSSSNACRIDNEETDAGMSAYRLAEGISTTLLLCSVGALENNGLTIRQLKLCVIRPDAFNPNDVDGTLNKLKRVAHYLHILSAGEEVYRFETKPNINILLLKAQSEISDEKAQTSIVNRLSRECKGYDNRERLRVLCAPDADLPEQEMLTAVLMHPKYCALSNNTFNEETTEAIKNIALRVGNKDRVYRNTMFFVLCAERERAFLYEKTKEYLACDSVLSDSNALLEKEQKLEIASKKNKADSEVRNLLIQSYCVAAKCQYNTETHSYEVIKMETMKEFSDRFYDQIAYKIITRLKEDDWLLGGIGKSKLQEENLFPTADNPVSVQDVYASFLKDTQKPMITSENAVILSLNKYCADGAFNIAEGKPCEFTRVYKKESVPYLSAKSGEYWLVDCSFDILPPAEPDPPESSGENNTDRSGQGCGSDESNTSGSGGTNNSGGFVQNEQIQKPPIHINEPPTVYPKIRVSGNVSKDDFQKIWPVVLLLKNNKININVTLEAQSTEGSPLKSDGDIMRQIREAARKINLTVEP